MWKFGKFYLNLRLLIFHVMLATVRQRWGGLLLSSSIHCADCQSRHCLLILISLYNRTLVWIFHTPTTQVLPYALRLPEALFGENKKVTFIMKCLQIYWLHFVQGKACWSRSQWPRDLRRKSAAPRLLRLWVRISRGHKSLSVVSVVCCQVEVSAMSWSLVQRRPTDCGASLCVREICTF